MKKLVVFLLAIALIPSIQSCKKKEEPKPSAKELLTKSAWHHVKNETYDSNGNLTNTQTKDNKMVFTPSNDYYYYNNAGQIIEYGTWRFTDDDTKIDFTEHGTTQAASFNIDKLTESEFTISIAFGSVKYVLYFKR